MSPKAILRVTSSTPLLGQTRSRRDDEEEEEIEEMKEIVLKPDSDLTEYDRSLRRASFRKVTRPFTLERTQCAVYPEFPAGFGGRLVFMGWMVGSLFLPSHLQEVLHASAQEQVIQFFYSAPGLSIEIEPNRKVGKFNLQGTEGWQRLYSLWNGLGPHKAYQNGYSLGRYDIFSKTLLWETKASTSQIMDRIDRALGGKLMKLSAVVLVEACQDSAYDATEHHGRFITFTPGGSLESESLEHWLNS